MTAICEVCGGSIEIEVYEFGGVPVVMSRHDCREGQREIVELERLYGEGAA